ncbi:MAG: D-2-hydroxyacid dehydrogenase [Woeseiaceae bacterium]|nr:D-2-hydroxyacid dehydrogenase [Woeseiaceae bacterium]
MKAVFLDYGTMGPGLDLTVLHESVDSLDVFDVTSDDEIAERIRDVDIVFTNKFRFTPELLQQAPKLRFIGLTATGTDNIDLAAAEEHGIGVANIRGYCTQSVVEHVFGVLLMLTHSLPAYRASVRAGEWQKAVDPFLLTHPVRELSAMTLGIVGFGELGQGVARAGTALGMNVLVSARPWAEQVPKDRFPFATVLEQSDVVSLHCPLNEQTRNLFGAEQFRAMKPSAILINTARGGLVDSAALAAALENGDIAAAAVDVLPKEPPVDGDPLLDYEGDNLIVTPHIAWATNEARQNAIDELAANVRAFIAGEQRNRVV